MEKEKQAPTHPQIKKAQPTWSWHISIRCPNGSGFDLVYNKEKDLVDLLRNLVGCTDEGSFSLAEHVQMATEISAQRLVESN